jgi:glutaredoxin-related protein
MIIDCCAFWSELVYLFGNVITMHSTKQKTKTTRSTLQNDVHVMPPCWMMYGSFINYFLHFYQKWGMKEARCEETLTVVFMITTLTQTYKYSAQHTHIQWNLLKTFLTIIQQTKTYEAVKHVKRVGMNIPPTFYLSELITIVWQSTAPSDLNKWI